jgi:hypothetical protein
MALTHWNYFLAIEQDVINLSRYIEFCKDNFKVYSIEIARIIMASTQEIDVVMKQICANKGNSSESESEYRTFIPTIYPKFTEREVEISRYELLFMPFAEWKNNKTPTWWTANNKIKHQRNTHFSKASLENMLKSVCGLMITDFYFYHAVAQLDKIDFGSQMLYPIDIVKGVGPSPLGVAPIYELDD